MPIENSTAGGVPGASGPSLGARFNGATIGRKCARKFLARSQVLVGRVVCHVRVVATCCEVGGRCTASVSNMRPIRC